MKILSSTFAPTEHWVSALSVLISWTIPITNRITDRYILWVCRLYLHVVVNWSQHQAADLLSLTTTFPDSHRAFWLSYAISASAHHLFSWDVTIVPNYWAAGISFLLCQALWLVKTVRNLSKTETHTFIWKCRTINMWDEATRDQSLYRDPCHAAEAHGIYSHSSNDLIFSGSDLKNHKVNWRLSECQFMNYCFIMIDLCTWTNFLMILFFLQIRKPLVEK